MHVCIVCVCLQRSRLYRFERPTTRAHQGVIDFVKTKGINNSSLFSEGHINGYTIPTPVLATEFPNRATLVAYTVTFGGVQRVRFGDAVCFVLDLATGNKYAVVRRRVIHLQSHDPFYICVESHVAERTKELVPVADILCPCSEMRLRESVPRVAMVIFHQLCGDIHTFE
jgi:hypothetical protein